MTSEAYKAFLRDHEAYPNPRSTHAEAPRLRQPVEPRRGSSRRSFFDDALTDRSKSDRLRARRHLHNSAAHHDRERSEPDKQAYVEEEDPETGALHRWEPESDMSSVHGRAGGISEKLASRPKQENRILSQESVTTNNEARKHHQKARVSHETDWHTIDGKGHRDTLEDYGLTKDYIESWHICWGEKSEKRTRKKIMADLNTHLTLQKLRQEEAARKATHLASLQPQDPKPLISNDMSSSRRAINTPKDTKPGTSIRTRTEASSTRSASCLPTVRPNRHDYTKNEHENLVQQRPVVHYPGRPNNTYEAKITPNSYRSSPHRESKSQNEVQYVDVGCQTSVSLPGAGLTTEKALLRAKEERRSAASGFC